MKKILFLMFAAVLFAACSKDDDEENTDNGVQTTIEFADYSSTVDMGYAQMLNKFGDPTMAFGTFYSYDIKDGKTESLTMATNNNKVYMVMQSLVENAYKFEDIYNYFASKYTVYEYHEAGLENEDGEEYEVEASATFGNAERKENATLIIEVNGSSSVSYTDPTNSPAEPEPSDIDFSNIAPEEVPAMFLGRSWEEVEEEYGSAIQSYSGMKMINVEGNAYYTCIFLEVEDGIVSKVQLLFEDLDDAEVIAYYEDLGYFANDCGEEDGVHMYLFMNMETMDMFTYVNPVATFIYTDSDAYDEEDDYDDED